MIPKILIVEDSLPNLDILQEMLKSEAECVCARTGREAIEKFNESLRTKEFYNVILLDIGLPEISGIRLLQKIRLSESRAGIPLGEGIPIIMVTASKDRFIEAFDEGCHDYILKPVDPELLFRKVRKYIPQNTK